jgi:hypothetical protein
MNRWGRRKHGEPDGRAIEVGNAHHLHQTADGAVWLNTEASHYDGLCIGYGATPEASLAEAVKTLEAALDALQGPPTAWKETD